MEDFADTFARYLPVASVTPLQAASSLNETYISKRNSEEACNGSEAREPLANTEMSRCNGSEPPSGAAVENKMSRKL